MEGRYNENFLGPVLLSTFFASKQPARPLVPSILMLARWELGLLTAWNVFFICTTVFIMGTDKISPLPEAPDWIYLFYQLSCAPNSHSVFLSPTLPLPRGQSQRDPAYILGYSVLSQ